MATNNTIVAIVDSPQRAATPSSMIGAKSSSAPAHAAAPTTSIISDMGSFEAALAEGLLAEWRQLAADDPKSSLFQAPGWCLEWYRAYAANFSPFFISVRDGGRLVGVVPMAVDASSREFGFAGRSSADYRDILALPPYRRQVVDALLDAYQSGGFRNTLSVGWMDEASDTPALLREACIAAGLRSVERTHTCWRWFPPAPARPNGQKYLNWYKRHGAVRFEVIDSLERWREFRGDYFRQHSLRQLQTGREMAFDDPVRRRFYDALFSSPDMQSHVTGFFVNDRLVAAHFGPVWRSVLHLGPPAIRLEDEQRSPAVVLLSWIIQNAASLGLAGFDMTIGDTDFKRRLGNQRFELTMVDVYPTQLAFVRARSIRTVVGTVKKVVARLAGESTWKARVVPLVERAAVGLARIRERGPVQSLALAARALPLLVYERRVRMVYTLRKGGSVTDPSGLAGGETLEVHDNRPEDLLAWNGSSPDTAALIGQVARNYGRAHAANRTLHTLTSNGRLAGWGFSFLPEVSRELTELPSAGPGFEPGAVSLYDFHTLPGLRRRQLHQALLAEVVRRRFAEGAEIAYIMVLGTDRESREAIEGVGFCLWHREVSRRFCGRIVSADPSVSLS
jgi:CelD/BcsL family acetyltransferase involved in cellulose biosynthesis/ribosomal protein S18 acetylase RimI-like enzyme